MLSSMFTVHYYFLHRRRYGLLLLNWTHICLPPITCHSEVKENGDFLCFSGFPVSSDEESKSF